MSSKINEPNGYFDNACLMNEKWGLIIDIDQVQKKSWAAS